MHFNCEEVVNLWQSMNKLFFSLSLTPRLSLSQIITGSSYLKKSNVYYRTPMQVQKNVYALFTRKSQQMTEDAPWHFLFYTAVGPIIFFNQYLSFLEELSPVTGTLRFSIILLICCSSLSSFAFSSLGPARRVLRPSDILTPYWKAALSIYNTKSLLVGTIRPGYNAVF